MTSLLISYNYLGKLKKNVIKKIKKPTSHNYIIASCVLLATFLDTNQANAGTVNTRNTKLSGSHCFLIVPAVVNKIASNNT